MRGNMANTTSMKDFEQALSNLSDKQSYIRKDSETGFTEQKAEIARLKATHQMKCITQKLLGDFDKNGEYVIEEKIMQELIAMPKLIDSEKDGVLKLSYEYKDGQFFKMNCPQPVKLPDGSLYCTLVFDEDIEYGNGYVIDTISTVVGSFTCKKDQTQNFDELRKKAFHIYKRDDPDAKSRKPTDAIDARLAYLNALLDNFKNKEEEIEEKYYNRRMEIMSDIPEGPSFLREFRDLTQSLENFFLKGNLGNRFSALNDLLNIMIDGKSGQAVKMNPRFDQMMYGLDLEYLASVGGLVSRAMQNRAVKTAAHALNSALSRAENIIETFDNIAVPFEQQNTIEQQRVTQQLNEMEQQATQAGNEQAAEQIKQAIEKQKQKIKEAEELAKQQAEELARQREKQKEHERVM